MKKAFTTKALILFTVLFIVLAVFSFRTFEKDTTCAVEKKCSSISPVNNRGEMIWDLFSKRFISLVSSN